MLKNKKLKNGKRNDPQDIANMGDSMSELPQLYANVRQWQDTLEPVPAY